MWFMNHVFNPIVRWILSGRLHGLMSKRVLLISFRGRKSGKPYTTPVEFIESGKEVWIMVGSPEKKHWWLNLVGGAPVNLCLHGEWVLGEAVTLKGEEDRSQIVRGLGIIIQKYPSFAGKYANYASAKFDLTGIVLIKIALD